MIAYLYFSFIWYIGRSYWVRDGCSAIIFVKHVKTVFNQVLSLYTKQCGCINCCFVVKAPANAIMQRKCQLGQKQFWLFYKLNCCAAIHGRIWMNDVPNESRIIMLSCTEVSFVISFFRFWGILIRTRVSFFFFTHTVYNVIIKFFGSSLASQCVPKAICNMLIFTHYPPAAVVKMANNTVIETWQQK